ncbi:MAG: glycosyltransferase [Bacteroides sp.]|nr:glycosyltransferase [Bacteroides sp.]
MRTVLLLTESYPLGGVTEEAFVKPEIEALASVFERVVVVPVSDRGPIRAEFPLNVTVARDVIESRAWRRKWIRPLCHPVALLHGWDDVRYSLAAAVVEQALKAIAGRMNLSPADTVMESFWFDFMSSALSRMNKKYGYKYVVRAHRYDVYTDRAPVQRELAIARSAGVFAVSDSGAGYLKNRFPKVADKISTAYLGVDTCVDCSEHSLPGDKTVRLLTIARVTETKRCRMCYEFVNALATARPQWKFEWTLIGDGPELENLRCLVQQGNHRTNLTVNLAGAMSHAEVMDYYASAVTDWFMLLSASEGLSIALLEAMAHGIPAIATDVGGIQEAVDDSTGLLLAPDSEPEEFVRGLMPFLDSRLRYEALCDGARLRVVGMFDAGVLRREWVRMLKSLVE